MVNGNKTSEKPRRVLVIGLDGATFELIHLWAEQGHLPTMKRLLEQGARGPLTTVTPPLTGPAWVSFMTGKNPGKHGIFDFVVHSPHSYNGKPINAAQCDGESLWSILSRAGKRVGVFMVPVTYPPEPVNGFMVTGMLTPTDAVDFTYPLELAEQLKTAVPNMTVAPESVMHPLGREHQLLAGLDELSDMMMAATNYLMKQYHDWDFFMTVFKEPDVAMHWLWRFMDTSHPWYTEVDDTLKNGLQKVYQRMDTCVAELVEKAGDDTLILLMSDHGAGRLDTYFYVNAWLVQEGFLHLKKDAFTQFKRLLYQLGFTPVGLYKLLMKVRRGGQAVAQTMRHRRATAISLLRQLFLSFDSVDWSRTTAYSLGNYGQIYVNLKGRDPQGIVQPGAEYDQVVAQLMQKLENLVDPRTNEPVTGRAYRGDTLYHGGRMSQSPDVVFMPDDLRINGFGLYQFPSKAWLEPTFDRSGGHRMDGIMMAYGPGVQANTDISDARIIDLAPTILAAMGVAIPDDMDGQVLTTMFDDDFFDDRPIHYTTAKETAVITGEADFSADDETEIRERLRGLGYMG